jgi:MGT family glycosyltransferase
MLFVVPPLTGHVNPAVAIASELVSRGHEVAVAGHASVIGHLLPPELPLFPLNAGADESVRADIEAKSRALRGPASLKFLWDSFLIPLGAATAVDVGAAIDAFKPDALVVDQQAVGAAVVARRRGLRWATLATTSAEFDDPYAILAGVGQWVTDRLRDFQIDQGVSPAEAAATDPRFSEHLTLVCSVSELLRPANFPPHYVFVGSVAGWRRAAPRFPFEELDLGRSVVLVSLGTVTKQAGGRFLSVAVRTLESMAETVQGVVVAPPGLLSDQAGAGGLLVRPYVPQLELMSRVAAVVCHGGNNTVCEALAHGVPLVVAPVRDDQPVIGEQVVRAGAGVRVRFGRVGPTELRTALHTVLEDPSYRLAAEAMRQRFTAAGGAAAAADHVEKLAS